MKKIILIVTICTLFTIVGITNKEPNINIYKQDLIQSIADEKAQTYAESVVYMLDLGINMNSNAEYSFNIDELNQNYVECFNIDFLTNFLENQFLSSGEISYNIQHSKYIYNKSLHRNLTQDELILLDEYNKYCDEYHSILEFNETIFEKIAEKNNMTVENIKEVKLSTPMSYDKLVYGDEDYGHMFKSTYIEISPELKEFKNKYIGIYPFNYKVNIPWEYEFYTTQYDASLYGFYYPDVTKEFHIDFSDYDIIIAQDLIFKNNNNLSSYTVYNNCIEVIYSNSNINYKIPLIVDIDNEKITNISSYIPSKNV